MTYWALDQAKKSSQLIEQVQSIVRNGPNDIAFRRIEQEAQSLMEIDAVGAHTVLGMLSAIRGSAEKVRYHYNIALRLSGRSSDTLHNYSVCLLQVSETEEAIELSREAFQCAPDNSVVLKQLILAAIESAHFREARNLCDHWTKLFPDHPVPHEPQARTLAGAVEREAFREESVREVLRLAQDIRNAANFRKVSMTTLVEDHAEPDSFLYKLYIDASPETAAELNEKFADRIVDRLDLMDDPGFAFVPMFIGIQ